MNAQIPKGPPVVTARSGQNIIVSPRQRGNRILPAIQNVGKEFGDIRADYQVGTTTGILYLSLKYHRLHPEYIYGRIEELGRAYNLRVLLIHCDVTEHQEPIRELTKTCIINNLTILVAWTDDEVAYYISTFKQFEHKPPDLIKERVDKDYTSMLRTALTSISKVNKTDVETLRTAFGSVADIARASSEQLQNLPGFGPVKAKRVKDAFEKPFYHSGTASLPSEFHRLSQNPGPSTDSSVPRLLAQPSEAAGSSSSRPSAREASPVWDIELDLNDDNRQTAAQPQSAPRPSSADEQESVSRTKRPPSPVWDIELDLNASDEE